MHFGARYRSADPQAQVGGDVLDVRPTPRSPMATNATPPPADSRAEAVAFALYTSCHDVPESSDR